MHSHPLAEVSEKAVEVVAMAFKMTEVFAAKVVAIAEQLTAQAEVILAARQAVRISMQAAHLTQPSGVAQLHAAASELHSTHGHGTVHGTEVIGMALAAAAVLIIALSNIAREIYTAHKERRPLDSPFIAKELASVPIFTVLVLAAEAFFEHTLHWFVSLGVVAGALTTLGTAISGAYMGAQLGEAAGDLIAYVAARFDLASIETQKTIQDYAPFVGGVVGLLTATVVCALCPPAGLILISTALTMLVLKTARCLWHNWL